VDMWLTAGGQATATSTSERLSDKTNPTSPEAERSASVAAVTRVLRIFACLYEDVGCPQLLIRRMNGIDDPEYRAVRN